MGKSKLLIIILPLTIILLAWAGYEYGYLYLDSAVEQMREERDQKEKMLYKYTATISQRQHIVNTLTFLRPAKSTNDQGFIVTEDPAQAGEVLKGVIAEIVSKAGGQIVNDSLGEPVKTGSYWILQQEVELMLPDARALYEIVHGIEAHNLYLVVREMETDVLDQDNPRELTAKMKIEALGAGR